MKACLVITTCQGQRGQSFCQTQPAAAREGAIQWRTHIWHEVLLRNFLRKHGTLSYPGCPFGDSMLHLHRLVFVFCHMQHVENGFKQTILFVLTISIIMVSHKKWAWPRHVFHTCVFTPYMLGDNSVHGLHKMNLGTRLLKPGYKPPPNINLSRPRL